MLGKIEEIIDNSVTIKLDIDITKQPNLANLHVVFEDGGPKKIVAEIASVTITHMKTNIVGEIRDNVFAPGSNVKPKFSATVRLIKVEELELIFGKQSLEFGYTNLGTSNVYEGYKINVGMNEFFNKHFSIMGVSGSGKSCTVASVIQRLYLENPNPPINSSLFFFDAYGEYTSAFGGIHAKNPNVIYKSYTTNVSDPNTELLRIPPWLLDVDDLALLLDVDSPAQLPIIDKALKLVSILTGNSDSVIKRKNDIIARALQDILLSGKDSTKIRDQVVGVLTKFNTETLNLNSKIVQPGYVRTLKQCLYIDKTGKMQEMELVVEFVGGYILDEQFDIPESDLNKYYSLSDLELAMEFSLVNEGILKSDKVYDSANVLNVRLHTLATGDNRNYFSYPDYVTKDEYIESLVFDKKSLKRAQIINFNINYVDDRIAKAITKIISRMLFLKVADLNPRGSRAFHIIIEEAHRYVQNDSDVDVIGYNIFERISKEGRKYGVFLGLITQRPEELSSTCVSQCANFIILRTIHPNDLQYIKDMVPNITQEIVLQLKNLKPGNCIAFGSAFKVPTSLYINKPDPEPLSSDVDLKKVWYQAPAEPIMRNVSTMAPRLENASSVQDLMAQQMASEPTANRFIPEGIGDIRQDSQVDNTQPILQINNNLEV
ncbi:MAG: ATP-binding protein [Bacilli bacterium]|nr:ATP-binding protein [Bacilli bacterium]